MPLSPELRRKIIYIYLKRDEPILNNLSDLKDYIEQGQGLNVTETELTSIWEEYTNLQTQSAAAAAAPAAFFSSARNSPDRSILDDINIMLDILKQRALLVANKPYVEGFNWMASDTDNKNNIECTQVSIALKETGHSAKRLYAITSIIDAFVSFIQKQTQIKLFCDDDSDRLTLRARYTTEVKLESNETNTQLTAPIALFPFDELKHALNEGVMDVFSNWQQDDNDSKKLFINTDIPILQNNIYANLTVLQNAYHEIDKKYNLVSKFNGSQKTIIVDKEAMNKLSRLMTGKDLIIEPNLQERASNSPR